MSFGLSDRATDHLQTILLRHAEITRAILYGSRAMGREKPGSDIDLTLVGLGLNSRILVRVLAEVEESDIPYTVDLSIYKDIQDADVKVHIDRCGVIFYDSVRPLNELNGPGHGRFMSY